MVKKLPIQIPRPKLCSLALGVVFIFLVAYNAQAFTVYTRAFPAASTTYVMDSSFSSQGSGWNSTANGAAADWNGTGTFSFFYNASSPNHLRAEPIVGSAALAVTYPIYSGTYRTRFDILVNTGQGYAFYDGSQAPTLPPNYYDLQSILRHEFGHGLGLGHSAANGTLMFKGGLPQGQIRQIDVDATNGAQYLYNSSFVGFPEGKGPEGSVSIGTYDDPHPNAGYVGTDWTPSSGWPKQSP